MINKPILLSGRSHPALAKHIAKLLKLELHEPISVFADGETRVRIGPNMRRRQVFIIQPTAVPVNDNIMELVLMTDAARRASATEINAVIPYFGYSRQDRKEMPRVPISSSVVASMITNAGVDHIVTVDIHSEQQTGFSQTPWDNLFGSYSIIPFIKKKKLKNLVVASPDKGGVLQATAYARLLGAKDIAFVYKQRDIKLNDISNTLGMIGEVKNKNVLLVDDVISTGGTIVNAANYIKANGAASVRVASTHGVFSGDAIAKIEKSAIEEVIITDTINQPEAILRNPKITVVSVAPLLAKAIERIISGESLSNLVL